MIREDSPHWWLALHDNDSQNVVCIDYNDGTRRPLHPVYGPVSQLGGVFIHVAFNCSLVGESVGRATCGLYCTGATLSKSKIRGLLKLRKKTIMGFVLITRRVQLVILDCSWSIKLRVSCCLVPFQGLLTCLEWHVLSLSFLFLTHSGLGIWIVSLYSGYLDI